MIENAANIGAHLKTRLQAIASPRVKEVRGVGLMIAVELHADAGGARRVCEALQQGGVLSPRNPHAHHPHRTAAADLDGRAGGTGSRNNLLPHRVT